MKYKCKICNKEFESKQKYAGHCSSHSRIIKDKIYGLCKNCGSKIIIDKSHGRKFCNRKCLKEYNEKVRIQKKKESCAIINEEECNNISQYELERYRKEHTKCEICGCKETINRRLAADHNHKTKKFRGVLCYKCNTAVGYFERYGKEMIQYLKNNYETLK